jgi:ppGpp synthetase/RelA/SpoT-type nucleotidyltranferase
VRQVEDRLRADYFDLLPSLQRTLVALETEVNYLLLPLRLELDDYARILVRGRVKECESAVDSLRRRQEGAAFDSTQPSKYSLTALPDLVGIRVLTFPESSFDHARPIIERRIADWTSDHIKSEDPTGRPIALKFHGHWNQVDVFHSEIQIVSLLIGLFWEVEHSAVYKPAPDLRGIARSLDMQTRTASVLKSLREFEQEFGRQIDNNFQLPSS